MKVQLKLKGEWNADAELVHVFTPGVIPNQFKVDDYMGPKASKTFRAGKFKETKMVFKTSDHKFVVIPDTSVNSWLWEAV